MNAREILAKIIELSNASVDVDRRLMNLVETLAMIFSLPFCALFLWDPQHARLTLKLCNKPHPAFPPGLSFSVEEGPLGACALQKIPVIINDASQVFLWDPRNPGEFYLLQFSGSFPHRG